MQLWSWNNLVDLKPETVWAEELLMFSSKHGTVRRYLVFSLKLPYPNYVFSFSFKLGMLLCVDSDSS